MLYQASLVLPTVGFKFKPFHSNTDCGSLRLPFLIQVISPYDSDIVKNIVNFFHGIVEPVLVEPDANQAFLAFGQKSDLNLLDMESSEHPGQGQGPGPVNH